MKRTQSNREHDSQSEDDGPTPTQVRKAMKTAGIVHKISLENFLCHDLLEITFNEQLNFIIGKNGSGKSAVLTGILIALGERATATNRGSKITDFIKTGKSRSVVRVTLLNKGEGAYHQETYGDYITIERTILAAGGGGYRILNENGKLVSNKRGDLNRILAKMNLQVNNPVCILDQETAKNFLHGSDHSAKYKLFERATQMDVMCHEFSLAEEELSRSKSCMKEKIQSLELLRADMKKWKVKNDWYEAVNEVHEKKAHLENMIAWSEVEDLERKASSLLELKEQQLATVEKARRKVEDFKEKLKSLEESFRTGNDDNKGKADEIRSKQAAASTVEARMSAARDAVSKIKFDIRAVNVELQRKNRDKQLLIDGIQQLQRSHGNSELARRREQQLKELEALKEQRETLCAKRKVLEHQFQQYQGAVAQFKDELSAARHEHSRLTSSLETKTRTLNELRRADANSYTVFGDWVPRLMERINQTHFRGPKPKGPLGAYVKVHDSSWAAVVENFLGARLFFFICSCDEDTKILNRLIDELNIRGQQKPSTITTQMTGKVHQEVQNYTVHCDPEMRGKDMHCLLDMLSIDDNDVANTLIDLGNIEQVMLIRNDQDAQFYLADASRVPHNCKIAITKEGNTFFPDPNYRSYAGRVSRSARYLQASVEEAIRNLEEEVELAKQEVRRTQENVNRLNEEFKSHENAMRSEERNLSTVRRDLSTVEQKMRNMEIEKEPEPVDVQALEEDLLDCEKKLERLEADVQSKTAALEEAQKELQRAVTTRNEHNNAIAALRAEFEPIKDFLSQNQSKQKEVKEMIEKLTTQLAPMEVKLAGFESDYRAASEKASSKASLTETLCARVAVTKSHKALTAELKQLTDQLQAREKELGSREFVFREYRKRLDDLNRAKEEINNSQNSLKKMMTMAKKRKEFIIKFRSSIMTRTHHVFQHLLKTRRFEGELRFDTSEKTLTLIVVPPGRDDASQPTPKRPRVGASIGTDIRSLSGGERSFATVCFILSLWDAIESPFRILDEFDVYMDHVNRKISMDLLTTEARENAGRQFIFLTPLGLDKEQQRPDTSIFKMVDPDRRGVREEGGTD